MQRIALIALSALILLAACGSPSDEPAASEHPPRDYFVWNDPGIAGGNFDADYGDCKAQVEKDPAVGASAPPLVVFSATFKCMESKGWKAIDPDAAASAKP